MDDSRIEAVTRRIEAALGRIAVASDAMQPGTGQDNGEGETPVERSTSNLVIRHENLRDSVEATLRDLDDLIGRLER
ncbi:hypothetical protein G7A66_00240 [Altererythrobacter sp. SALINAS58]|uniref:hypothetical protein n=1 Tax=Alteripontixanthobacter muriae TaxID=2705546 RepID=UPI001576F7D4|nr:hypothetical protein [Alteripontixanthobacter muriae]NTZ41542.1 hypothetical protein [Alteripontixanthobacter muriae]